MTFTGEITLGTIMTVITLIGIAVSIGIRFGRVETKQDAHAKAVEGLAAALVAHDSRDDARFDVVESQIGDLAKVVYTLAGASRGAP